MDEEDDLKEEVREPAAQVRAAEEIEQPCLFDFTASRRNGLAEVKRDPTARLWTTSKADLISAYLLNFVHVTHDGTYVDGFAGPQADRMAWAARKALEVERLQHFFLCDRKPVPLKALWELRDANQGRDIHVLDGDFNLKVTEVLSSGVIHEKEATSAY